MLGRSLGNYGVVSKIGEGGMGVVYLAKHVTLGRRAAIKVLRPDLSSNRDIVSRFFNEARAATAVRNPGIVEVYDFGFLEDRTAYIIMEYLDGESLASRMRRGRSTISVALTIVRAIARILQAAHEQGIVHRDLKPDNVFLVPDPELPSGERVKLLDFGIAKLTHGIGDASHTTTGTVMGTPTYMAPEQCRGAGTVDHRADLYSLGCVAYEMMCGQPPFVAEGPGDVIARHLYFEPAPLRSHRPEIPAELQEIILRLLKKEPRARYSNAAEFLRATDPLMAGTPSAAVPGESLKTEFVATLPLLRDTTTTLNGAASSSEISTQKTKIPRFAVFAGAATFAIVFLIVIIFFFVRGARSGEIGSNEAAAASTGESKEPERAAPPPAPGSAVSPPPSDPPRTTTAPVVGSPSSVNDAQQPTTTSHSGGSASDAIAQPSSPAPAPAPPEVQKPNEPATLNPAATPGNVTTPGDARKRTVITASGAAGISDDAPRSNDATASRDAAIRPSQTSSAPTPTGPKKSTPAALRPRPAATASATTTATQSEPPGTTATSGPSDAECTSASFASVLDAKAPSKAALDDAWHRLGKCKVIMKPALYSDIHRRLLEKS